MKIITTLWQEQAVHIQQQHAYVNGIETPVNWKEVVQHKEDMVQL